MADTSNQKTPEKAPEKTPENPHKAIREARLARLKVIDGPSKTIKVYAANETMRAIMRHPSGTRFQSDIGQAVDWPNDAFTTRRLAEGSISTDSGGSNKMADPDDTKNAREQAAANRPKPKKSEPENGKTEAKPAPKHQPPPSAA